MEAQKQSSLLESQSVSDLSLGEGERGAFCTFTPNVDAHTVALTVFKHTRFESVMEMWNSRNVIAVDVMGTTRNKYGALHSTIVLLCTQKLRDPSFTASAEPPNHRDDMTQILLT